jgi:hypothetical protein
MGSLQCSDPTAARGLRRFAFCSRGFPVLSVSHDAAAPPAKAAHAAAALNVSWGRLRKGLDWFSSVSCPSWMIMAAIACTLHCRVRGRCSSLSRHAGLRDNRHAAFAKRLEDRLIVRTLNSRCALFVQRSPHGRDCKNRISAGDGQLGSCHRSLQRWFRIEAECTPGGAPRLRLKFGDVR